MVLRNAVMCAPVAFAIACAGPALAQAKKTQAPPAKSEPKVFSLFVYEGMIGGIPAEFSATLKETRLGAGGAEIRIRRLLRPFVSEPQA